MKANTYIRWAEYYDIDPRNLYADDIQFYLDRALRSGGPVLELGCGTGRVTIPLAKAGFQVTGLDHSASMLEVFRRRLRSLPDHDWQALSVLEGDMCSFNLQRYFELVFIPFRSFQALTTLKMQKECLACVKRHLAPAGEFVIDVFRPGTRLDQSWVRSKQKDWTTVDSRTGRHISRYSEQKAIDTEKQVLDIEMSFTVSEDNKTVDKFTELLSLSYFYEDQLATLVERSGFLISERHGYYDGTPIDKGSELLLVCKHAD